ncbi:MAG: hypothetical protein ABI555_01055 [Chloroflexota bacterium]
MDTPAFVAIHETGEFAAVYHVWNEAEQNFDSHLAISSDLLNWTWQVKLADFASDPAIAAADDGGYVVAWEQNEAVS